MIRTLSKKAGFILAVAGAVVVGGAATAIVSAAIPSSADGKIHGCYRNNASLLDAKGALRVIDSEAGQSCTAQETALNIDQSQTVVSNRVATPAADGLSVGPVVLDMPEFGMITASVCRPEQNYSTMDYTNNTTHSIQGGTFIYRPGEVDGGIDQGSFRILGYTIGNVDYVANVATSSAYDPSTSQCVYQAKAIISHN